MTQDTLITLATLRCKREDDRNQGSVPYLWPVLIQIEQTESIIKVTTPSSKRAQVVIRNSQPGGQVAVQPMREQDWQYCRERMLSHKHESRNKHRN